MKKLISISLLFLAIAFAGEVPAAVTPLSVGIAPPVQFPPDDFTITGLRASLLWGRHRDMYGFDFGGLGNITDGEFHGLALSGVFNYTKGTTNIFGAQLAGLTNINTSKTNVYGLQASLGLNSNTAASTLVGVQFALVNLSEFTDVYGLQAGIYNHAKEVYGFQIGLVNITDNLHGIQIGLINFHRKGLIGVCPIINIGF
ncbi:MAG: hypothetical protein ACAH59_07685 [Pseudobdellovibrionaceae bacterium]